jgi:tetratricopeptide (TPR) repeat protein
MPIVVLLIGAITLQSGELPELNMANFLPAIRQQVQQAYAAAQANPKDAEVSGNLGMVLEAYEQYESAALCYRRAHLLDPNSFRWLFYLGSVEAAQGKHRDAVVTLGEALRIKPDYLPAQLKLADTLLTIGKLEESRNIYQAISKEHPETAEVHYGLGRIHAAAGDLAAAANSYRKACELFPPYGAAHYALGLAYRKLGQATESQQQFSLYEQNRMAVPPLDDPLRSDINKLKLGSSVHIRRGADLEQAGKIREAIAEQEEAVRQNPQAVQAHINLISLYGRLSQYDEAATHYQAAIDLNPNQADIHYNYGVLLLKQGRLQDAQKAFQQALQINPYYAEAHINLGSLYEQQGRLTEAFQQFAEAVENRPNYRIAHFHMGRILANQQKYDEAIQHFLKIITPEDDNTPGYLYALAATYARAGDLPRALKYARTARDQAASRGQLQLLASIDRDLELWKKQ